MTFWLNIVSYFHKYFSIPSISVIDIIEMVIIATLFYYVIIWLKRTSAWTLAKGIIVILVIMLLADIFNFSTIVWILSKTISVGVIAILIIFQPELRRALEQLGGRLLFRKIANINSVGERFSSETLEELLRAVAEMSLSRTGALITIEQSVSLGEYIRTGIELDARISSQLLENIFIDKSPLHDGAVVIRGDKIVAATCYYPLTSTKNLNKKYGTRHRAALGISEVSDSFTIVVSEETGYVSLTMQGLIIENITMDELRRRLSFVQNEQPVFTWFDRFRKGVKSGDEPESVPADDGLSQEITAREALETEAADHEEPMKTGTAGNEEPMKTGTEAEGVMKGLYTGKPAMPEAEDNGSGKSMPAAARGSEAARASEAAGMANDSVGKEF